MSDHREIIKILDRATKAGTSIRHARGVVISTSLGTIGVNLDNNGTTINAFCYAHTANCTVGAVVDLLLVGTQAYVIGAYDNDVPVGGRVTSWSGGGGTYAAGGHTLATVSVPLVNGHRYLASLNCVQAQQITNAASGATQLYTQDSLNLIPVPASGIKAFITLSPPVNAYMTGTGIGELAPSSTASDTFTVTLSVATSSVTVVTNGVGLVVVRTA